MASLQGGVPGHAPAADQRGTSTQHAPSPDQSSETGTTPLILGGPENQRRQVLPDAKFDRLTIYFNIGSSAVDNHEDEKIDEASLDYQDAEQLEIIASASEDEALLKKDTLDLLLEDRLDEVEARLSTYKFNGKIIRDKKPDSGMGRINWLTPCSTQRLMH